MPTPWTYPTIASQYSESEHQVPWLHNNEPFADVELDLASRSYEINQIHSAKDILHISNPTVNDIKMKTSYLVLTGFNWKNLPDNISGIEARINVRRTGRITDDTVKLYYSGAIGDNRATLDLSNDKTYGADNDIWGLELITTSMLNNVNFGLVLRYQSHPNYPHRVTPNMEHVQLRVW